MTPARAVASAAPGHWPAAGQEQVRAPARRRDSLRRDTPGGQTLLQPGSYLVISAGTSTGTDPDLIRCLQESYGEAAPVIGRTESEIAAWFDGLALARPGLADVWAWRPEGLQPTVPGRARFLADADRKTTVDLGWAPRHPARPWPTCCLRWSGRWRRNVPSFGSGLCNVAVGRQAGIRWGFRVRAGGFRWGSGVRGLWRDGGRR